ncbi:TonB-dependent siderophore receptor [Psychrobium sp. 1_MG-2023]|uniref:TonB-dependent receptor plug domain-containing protein n=1 Tax=Psychrobium sp. 1_MG-2023 TaxID=3062624 RepID=UPI000C34A331|nr:TonB-dependent receptor [Psychrobium sp. 1_MG-2023]MDP2559568.1 TonB-dependent receptor [Psychrobium sp. 1_MG-2023]PKF59407.1 TonB-dependent receptor [Alteromonadales bacterium alter-6D02]
MKLTPLSLAVAVSCSVSSFLVNSTALAEQRSVDTQDSMKNIEVITVTAPKLSQTGNALAEGNLVQPDVADWLKTVPGANINKNGPVTGIAQYRGLFGDRVAKRIGGHQIVGAGPNAMDAPLTYINPMMIESVSVYRGIAPVSSGIDSLGGAVEVKLKRAHVTNDFDLSGDFATSFNSNNDGSTLAASVNVSDNNIGLMAYISEQQGDNYQDGDDLTIKSSDYDKRQNGIDLRTEQGDVVLGATWHQTKTLNSGTVALPMDIDYIDSDRFNHDGEWQGQEWLVKWQLGYQDATHGMDNFSQRTNMMSAMHRYNTAEATTSNYKVELSNQAWLFGIEGFSAEHDSVITNPNNAMFKVVNFNQVENQRHSLFAQWSPVVGKNSYRVGLRVKQNYADAAEVMSSMAMMNPNVKALQDEFNANDRSVDDTTFDVVLTNQYQYSTDMTLSYGVAVKQRAASYQERYLWLPMQATGGLADGKTYVGNISLAPETAYQVNLGLSFNNDTFRIAPQFFYHRIDDYIQGSASSDMRVKMIAGMMAGDMSPLQFDNIDARLYGADINWAYQLTSAIELSGVASYVRGTREDINDNLYRITPLNARVNLAYQADNWQTNLALHAYHKQDKVSAINQETVSKGYAVVDWQLDYYVSSGLVVRGGVSNLLDKQYNAHLAGVNRANGNELAVGERITAMGRNAYIALDYQF